MTSASTRPQMGLLKDAAKSVLYAGPVRRAVRKSPRMSSGVMRLIHRVNPGRENTGGTDDARYCYGAWLRHWRTAGFRQCPASVVELGPGDSLGVGLAAMLCGADTLHGVDGHRYATVERTLSILDGLVRLMERREPIPPTSEFPEVRPHVSSYDFPSEISPRLELSRLDSIRACIRSGMTGEAHGACRISYRAPWTRNDIPVDSVDLVYSQAVMEHVPNPAEAYGAMWDWLRPGGRIAHQVDLRCHQTSLDWNGHWMYSEAEWATLQSRKKYVWINRMPCSDHLRAIEQCGFRIDRLEKLRRTDGLAPADLAPERATMSYDDVECEGFYVAAVKER